MSPLIGLSASIGGMWAESKLTGVEAVEATDEIGANGAGSPGSRAGGGADGGGADDPRALGLGSDSGASVVLGDGLGSSVGEVVGLGVGVGGGSATLPPLPLPGAVGEMVGPADGLGVPEGLGLLDGAAGFGWPVPEPSPAARTVETPDRTSAAANPLKSPATTAPLWLGRRR